MSRDNYKAWGIDINDFANCKTDQDKLRFLVNFAVLAPSSHNSQPWRFQVEGDSILVSIEPKRTIPIGDPENRFSRASIGCSVANILIASDYYGYSTEARYFPSDQVLVKIIFSKQGKTKEDKNHLIFSILNRVTNRLAYDAGRLPERDFLEQIRKLSAPHIELHLVSDLEKIRHISKICVDSSVEGMSDPAFREELSRHVKSNITNSKTGIPAFGLGMPTPPSLLAPFLVRNFNMSKTTYKKDLKIFEETPLFGIIATPEDTAENQVKAGELYEKIALLATRGNISTSMWGAPTVVGSYPERVSRILGISSRPQLLFRIGYALADNPSHSPRLSASEIMY